MIPTSPDTPPDDAPTMVAVSGGVDSAVALMRLVEAGVPVSGLMVRRRESQPCNRESSVENGMVAMEVGRHYQPEVLRGL